MIAYEIALVLSGRSIINLTKASTLFKSKRSFKIFKWDPNKEYIKQVSYFDNNESGRKIMCWKEETLKLGGYVPWLCYTGSRWIKVNTKILPKRLQNSKPNQIMMTAHKWFATENNFKNWIGIENYSKLVTDLL